jgi:hypothetical protein
MPARIAVWYPSFRFVAASVLNTPVVGSQSLDKLASTFADTGSLDQQQLHAQSAHLAWLLARVNRDQIIRSPDIQRRANFTAKSNWLSQSKIEIFPETLCKKARTPTQGPIARRPPRDTRLSVATTITNGGPRIEFSTGELRLLVCRSKAEKSPPAPMSGTK